VSADSDDKFAYASIYVRSTDRHAVTAAIAEAVGASECELLVKASDDRTASVRSDDFVLWPTLVEASVDPPKPHLVQDVAHVLAALWEAGLDAVAACDFEEQLPFAGGIRRSR
jgi:hypothetical protein